MDITTYVASVIEAGMASRTSSAGDEVVGRWRQLVEHHRPVGEAFQIDFLLTLLDGVAPLPPGDRLRCYRTAWWLGHDLTSDDILSMDILKHAAKITQAFGGLGPNEVGLIHFLDLFERGEILMRTLPMLEAPYRGPAVASFWQPIFERYAYVRSTFPGLIPEGEMGG